MGVIVHSILSENAPALGGGVAGKLIEIGTPVPAAVANDLAIRPSLREMVRKYGAIQRAGHGLGDPPITAEVRRAGVTSHERAVGRG
jgi:hypothetical protein